MKERERGNGKSCALKPSLFGDIYGRKVRGTETEGAGCTVNYMPDQKKQGIFCGTLNIIVYCLDDIYDFQILFVISGLKGSVL